KLRRTRQRDPSPTASQAPNIESEDDEDILFSSSIRPLEPQVDPNQDLVTPLRHAPRTSMHSRPSEATEKNVQQSSPLPSSAVLNSVLRPQTNTASKRPRSSSSSQDSPTSDQKRLRPHELEVTLSAGVKLSDKPLITDFSDAKVQSLLDRMIRLIKSHGSRIRGAFLTDARHEVKVQYGFVNGVSAKQLSRNLATVESLVTKDEYFFHYKNVKTRAGYCDNSVIVNILVVVCFTDETSFGVLYPEEFKPITIETLAFLFTLIHHCIKEWSSGKRIKVKFTETVNAKHYKVFYADLLKCRKGGLGTFDDPVPQLRGEAEECTRMELEAYTGDTESESDDNHRAGDQDN
ncbi:hypothetical protein H0H92_005061, partial [Tricholoma furcatifolium]